MCFPPLVYYIIHTHCYNNFNVPTQNKFPLVKLCVCVYLCVCACMCMCVCTCVCVFVGSCLATKVFIGNLPAMGRGWVIIK